MKFETITVNEYYGNDLNSWREAKLYENGTLEYLPEPVFEDDEEDLSCMNS